MVRALMALVLRRVLAWLAWSNEHVKDLEIVVLRHQLQVLRRHVGRPRFRWSDRLFLGAASCHLPRETWRAFLVTPQTVLLVGTARCPTVVVPRCRSPAGPTGPRRGDAGVDSQAGSRESAVGISADCSENPRGDTSRSGRWFEPHAVALSLQHLDRPARGPLRMAAVEVARAQLPVCGLPTHQMIRDHRDAVRYGHDGFLMAAAPHDATVLGGQRGVRPGRRLGRSRLLVIATESPGLTDLGSFIQPTVESAGEAPDRSDPRCWTRCRDRWSS